MWLKLQPKGHHYINVVVKVMVNHEGPQRLLNDLRHYFSPRTSIRMWMVERKFSVGWAENMPSGIDDRHHMKTQLPLNHHDIDIATNLIYDVPMATIFESNSSYFDYRYVCYPFDDFGGNCLSLI